MATHVKVVAWLHAVFASIGLLIVLSIGLFGGWIMHWLATQIPSSPEVAQTLSFFQTFGALGTLVLIFSGTCAAVELAASIALMHYRPWARIAILVYSFIGIFGFPVGTAVSIYSMWVLFHRETEAVFLGQRPTIPSASV